MFWSQLCVICFFYGHKFVFENCKVGLLTVLYVESQNRWECVVKFYICLTLISEQFPDHYCTCMWIVSLKVVYSQISIVFNFIYDIFSYHYYVVWVFDTTLALRTSYNKVCFFAIFSIYAFMQYRNPELLRVYSSQISIIFNFILEPCSDHHCVIKAWLWEMHGRFIGCHG